MSTLSLRCIRFALFYLACGMSLGVVFAFDRATGALLRPLHAELNLWGWLTLLIYGMAYHMLPRFLGRPLRWPRAAAWQSWLAIGGVGLAALGWALLVMEAPIARPLMGIAGALQLMGALIFAGLMLDLFIDLRRSAR
ncbi:MAG: hypothetical protein KatS3mg057_0617 [Herpetosiphonaceae bacterium]|nr:MAG: hypothetical protein KatS3mg057_0617 [Herpetosiphonaceae bacterium]